MVSESLLRRILPKIHVDEGTGCWLWTGRIDRYGYGHLGMSEGTDLSHRITYKVFRGPIPDGLQIDHLCRVRNCVNPSHLEPVTSRVNSRRGIGFPAKRAQQTHCINGHPFNDKNTYRRGWLRACRACNAAAQLRRKKARAA